MSGRRGNTRHANGWRRQQVVARVLAAFVARPAVVRGLNIPAR